MADDTTRPVAAIADPAPLGLGAFALTTFILSAHNAGWAPTSWAAASSLVVPLGVLHLRGLLRDRAARRYQTRWWAAVFLLGMYSVATHQLAATCRRGRLGTLSTPAHRKSAEPPGPAILATSPGVGALGDRNLHRKGTQHPGQDLRLGMLEVERHQGQPGWG
jgi:GPR1/FUN34/yaaH family